MGKKKKATEDKYDCWYCKRDFDDEATLVRHQRQKHFRCNDCGKQLYTINGLVAHAMTVHKTTISKVPNAVPERDSISVNVVGLEGYPDQGDDSADAKKPKVEAAAAATAAATPAQPPIIAAPQYPYAYPFPGAPPPFPPNTAYPPYYSMPGAPPVFPGPPRPGPVAPHMPPMSRPGPFPPPPLLPMGRPPMPPMSMPMPQPFPHNPALIPPNAPPHLAQATIPPPASAPVTATTAHAPVAPAATTAAPTMRLVYDDENYSMEEKRASLARYTFDSEANHAQQLLMDRSIDSRLASLR